ncbi:hypothetical protein ACFQ61_02120 [Streptomyces sp. NPDC056500]|uniref:hypothetical protein n=1 Tax=Streptomyces sp. NPDC056500 TaxID=3345840 RepID=UPI0036A74E83
MTTPTPTATAPSTGTAPTGQADPSGTGQPAGQDPTTAPATAPTTGQPEGDESALPAWAQKALSDARAEAGKTRVTAKQKAADDAKQQYAQEIGKILGLVKDDSAADPTQLTAQLTAAQAQARQNAVELAAFKAAGAENARADRLLNSRSFLERLADLDPSAADFGAQMTAAIKAEIATDPDLYKAGPTKPHSAAKGGADFSSAPTGERKAATLNDAVSAALSG